MFWYWILSFVLSPAIVDNTRIYAPDEFLLNTKTRLVQRAWNANYATASTDLISDEAFSIDSNCTVVLSVPGCTQYRFECTPVFGSDRSFELGFRTTRTDFTRNAKHGVHVFLNTQGMRIEENGRLVMQTDTMRLSATQEERVQISNFAGEYTIRIGCDKEYRGHTELMNCDAVVLHSSDHAAMKFHNIVRNSAFNDLE